MRKEYLNKCFGLEIKGIEEWTLKNSCNYAGSGLKGNSFRAQLSLCSDNGIRLFSIISPINNLLSNTNSSHIQVITIPSQLSQNIQYCRNGSKTENEGIFLNINIINISESMKTALVSHCSGLVMAPLWADITLKAACRNGHLINLLRSEEAYLFTQLFFSYFL